MSENARFWKCRVDCWRQMKNRNFREKRYVLVQALDHGDAMEVAQKFCDATARLGPIWVGFECVEAVTVQLPIEMFEQKRMP